MKFHGFHSEDRPGRDLAPLPPQHLAHALAAGEAVAQQEPKLLAREAVLVLVGDQVSPRDGLGAEARAPRPHHSTARSRRSSSSKA
ncbi:hypothetical protein DYH09_03225 [bacterium CPR1]|nr:hypothetical protein [bacterium CPR1]